MPALPHRLDRIVTIGATPETVFRFFTDSRRWAVWWGAGSTIDATPGGAMFIRYPNGVEVSGTVIDVRPPHEIVFTYGYATGTPIPPGGSRVTIRLEQVGDATRVHLTHEFADAEVRDHHVQGWRYQLSLFGNVVADEVHAAAPAAIDAWFEAWADTDASRREKTLGSVAEPAIRFHDRFSNIEGLAELAAHITGAQRFMPGFRMTRTGDVRQCQGTAVADWIAVGPDGKERARGLNVFVFNPRGRIESVTGFMSPMA